MAGRVDSERSRRAAMGASKAGAMAGGVDYHCKGTWLVMELGPCAEWTHLLRSVVTRHALYQRPEGRDVARVPWARGVVAEWQVRQFMITSVGLVKAAHCIGFEIILQSSRIFCDSLTCHYPSRPQPLFLVHQTNLEKFTDLSLLANRTPLVCY